jgi:hypothetical protein
MDAPDEFGSLFDDAVATAPLSSNAQATVRREAEWDMDVTSGFATMNEEPEPALPKTDGADEDPAITAARLAVALRPRPPVQPQHPRATKEAGFPLCAKGCNYTLSAQDALVNTTAGMAHEFCPAPVTAAHSASQPHEERGRRLLAYVDASMAGQDVPGENPFVHLLAGQEDGEMKLAAERFLTSEPTTKTALKTYDLAERNAIINEGEGVEASNLDRLDISGTHYEALEAAHAKAAAVSEDEDLWMLDGDPNGPDL